MVVERILSLATVLVLAATLPLSLVAIRGFRGAPFGAVLRPLPVVLVAYIALNSAWALDVSVPPAYQIVTSTVATGAVLVSAAHVLVLLTERRKL
ncbi:hypothetical protein NGM10_01190 [Halorussus salilacus]|uniref:hypothetical protein n=1 Tax=Halorussus salilacus TaxID=2953750 RepID=UPI0020A2099D|nr:hypothetical protein [Halorussus salilacus]USZ68369.1 hypothetical protein NGM10_01190 [Halorussus salilacus]